MPNATSAMPGWQGHCSVLPGHLPRADLPRLRVLRHHQRRGRDRRRPDRNRAHLPRLRHRMAPRVRHRLGGPAMTARVAELDALTGRGMFLAFYDPDGSRYGLPTYPYHWAPAGLLTAPPAPRQRAAARRPGHHRPDPVAPPQTAARRLPLPRSPRPAQTQASPAQLAAIAKALRARRTCPPAGPRSPTTSRGRSANASTAPRKAVTPMSSTPSPQHGTTPTSSTTGSSPSSAAARVPPGGGAPN